MEVDASTRLLCPFCDGGQSKEVSMTVHRNQQGLLYNCHRATCGNKGFIPTNGILLTGAPKKEGKKSKIRKFDHPTIDLREEDYDFFYSKFELDKETVEYAGVKYCPRLWRFAFPVFDYFGRTVGINTRSYCGGVPKTILYPFTDDPIACWYDGGKVLGKKTIPMVIVVEDQLSALKINSYTNIPTIALLGTSLSEDTVRSIAFVARKLVVWLDYDAIMKAKSLSDKFSLSFTEGTQIIAHNTDPKDTPAESLIKIVNKLS